MSEGNGLPKGWAEATLGDVTHAKVSQDGAEKGSSFVYVDISSVNNEIKRIGEPRTLPFSEAPSRARQRLEEGDVLVSMTRPNLNAVAIVPDSLQGAIGSTGFDVLRPKEVASGWLLYAVQTNAFVHTMCELVQGALYPAVRPRDIRAYRLPLPPLPEQHRIVEKVEELFSDLDAGVASLERAKANLKRYRASVLKSAVEGRLTEEWRKEYPQAEDGQMLLDRILRERREKWEKDQLQKFKEKGKEPPKGWESKYEEPSAPDTSELPELPEGWVWATVEQLSVVVRGSSPRPAGDPRYFGGSVPWITVGPITADNEPYLTQVSEGLTEEGRENSRFIEPHTLLLTNSGATLGVPKITLIGGCINDGVAALLGTDYPLKLYLLYFLHTQTALLRGVNQGAAQPNLNTAIIKSIWVPLPPLAEQEQIVALVEERLSQIDSAEKTIDAELIRSKKLRQSILKRAFEGKLVPQDPKDEPASVLLERIKATRESEQPKKRARKAGAR